MATSPSNDRPTPGNEPTPSASRETISLSAERRIDQICMAFEGAWKAGRQPRLEDCLGTTTGPERSALLTELLLVELEHRRRLGQQPTAQEYQARFSGDDETILSAFRRAARTDEQSPAFCEPAAESATTNTVQLAAGTKLGRYRVERVLGSGTFGDVYLAWDEELNRSVAVKVMRPRRFASQTAVDRFLEEARTAARLEHPAIVPVHDVGRSDDGRPFIVMQYVEGQSLRDRLRAARVSHAEAAELIQRVAEALHFAHQRGVVHRDLKPGNILLDAQGQPHVADFGLAFHESAQREHAGELSGTLPYMAPEQMRRESHRLDGRTDVWAMGVMLYEMLTGRRPFNGQNEGEIADEIEHRDPKPPRQIDDTIPAELERICLRSLAKPIAERYTTAADLAADLRGALHPGHFALWIAVGAAIAALVIAAVTLALWRPWEPKHVVGSAGEPQAATALAPLSGTLDVLVYDPEDSAQGLRLLRESGVLPVKVGHRIRIQAELTRPAYVYLLWINSRGSVSPIYPWSPGQWTRNLAHEKPIAHVALPEAQDLGWPMEPAPAGMETLLLLARESPLPVDVDLHTLLVDLPPQPLLDRQALVWFHDGQVVTRQMDADRGPNLVDPREINLPVLKTQHLLQERLGRHFTITRAVSFASQGK